MRLPNAKKVVLWFWFPFACGILKGLDQPIVGEVALYHLVPLVLYCVVIMWALRLRVAGRFDPLFLLLVVYIGVSGIAVLGPGVSLFSRVIALLGLYLFAAVLASTMSFAEILAVLYSSAVAWIFICLAVCLVFPHFATDQLQGRMVYSAIYVQKNTFGRFLSVAMMVIIARLSLYPRRRRDWLVGVAALMASAVMLELSDSRTSLGAVIVFCGALAVLRVARAFKVNRLVVGAAPIVVAIGLAFAAVLVKLKVIRLSGVGSIHDQLMLASVALNVTGRATIWAQIFRALSSNHKWLFGFGYGGFFGPLSEHYLSNIGLGDWDPGDAHNGYVDVIANIGLVGLVLVGCLVVSASRTLKKYDWQGRTFWSAFLAMYLVANVTQSYFIKSSNVMPFLFYLCMTGARGRRADVEAEAKNVARPTALPLLSA